MRHEMSVYVKSIALISGKQREIAAQVHNEEKAEEQSGHGHDQLPADSGTKELFEIHDHRWF
jgi:hypothetical protein